MTRTPKPKNSNVGLPAPAPADYSDELSDENWKLLTEEVEQYQNTDGEVVSGEPW